MYENAVTQLREYRKTVATRQFNARGKSLIRCEHCMLAENACICGFTPRAQSSSDFVLMMHRDEVFKPTNTGRLIADVLPQQTQAFCWHRTAPEDAFLTLINDPLRNCVLVYPETENSGAPVFNPCTSDKKTTFILLDGTWKQARRMASLSRWLDKLPRFTLPETLLRSYAVRKSAKTFQLSTVEAAALCLQSQQEHSQADTLLDYFALFNLHYLASRGCYTPSETALHTKLQQRASKVTPPSLPKSAS